MVPIDDFWRSACIPAYETKTFFKRNNDHEVNNDHVVNNDHDVFVLNKYISREKTITLITFGMQHIKISIS